MIKQNDVEWSLNSQFLEENEEFYQKWIPILDINNIRRIFLLLIFILMEPESDEQNHQKRNPIKKAEKQKQFRTVGQMKEIYTDPTLLYEAARKYDKTFKTVTNVHPKNKKITIIDFSLNARGPDEDEIYVKQPFYRNNIRRGNTFVINKNDDSVVIGRKGLKKFFDISKQGLRAIEKQDIMSLSKKDRYNHYAVFEEVENVLSCNEELQPEDKAKVHIYRLNKANGENAQVSYYPQTDEWIISSKNVSIMIKEMKDVKNYQGQRYGFAILIAQAWLQIVSNLNKNQVQELKKELVGKTMIGEYCGNPDFQHLVKYAQITIYFYALVQNNSPDTCLMPNKAFAFFEKYHIPIVKNYHNSYVGEFTAFREVGIKLIQIFDEISKASIFDEEEGIQKPKKFCEYISDRYLQNTVPIPEKWEEQESWVHVSSLGKLKTIEYRIFRKLREKLKFFTRLKKKEDTQQNKEQEFKKFQQKYGSFEKQTYDLLRGITLSKPIEYYFCIGLLAFQYTYNHKKSSKAISVLTEHYLDFLSVVFWCVQQKRPVTEEVMRDQALHEQLRKETWQNYSTEIVAEYPAMLQRIVPKYAKIKKSMKAPSHEDEEMEMEMEMQKEEVE